MENESAPIETVADGQLGSDNEATAITSGQSKVTMVEEDTDQNFQKNGKALDELTVCFHLLTFEQD